MSEDQTYLPRAIRLAMNGRGSVEPNPMVGCVLVKKDRVIGEGIHARYGGPHAEPTALGSCTENPAGATAYVTLEPCCHLNKQTPPCAPRLIEAKIARVVAGCLDPNPDVNGKGFQMLRAAGIQVDGPFLEPEAKQLLAPFIARTVHKRPYITLKWAESADGKIAGPGGKRVQISNAASSRVVHQLRARCDAIMVGINTVLTDDPMLTARDVNEAVRPITRCVLDRQLRIPLDCQLVRTARAVPLIIATDTENPKATALQAAGASIIPSSAVWSELYERRVMHVLVETGPTLARSMFTHGLCDRLWVIRSPKTIGDDTAPSAAPIPSAFIQTGKLNLDGDVLTEYLNPASEVFFKSEPSADFVLTRDA